MAVEDVEPEATPEPITAAEKVEPEATTQEEQSPLLKGVDVCAELDIKDYKLTRMSDEAVLSHGFERVRVGEKSKYRRLVNS